MSKTNKTLEQQNLHEISLKAADYWRSHVVTHPHFNPGCQCLVVLLLTTCHRICGHHFVAMGMLDSALVHPRQVFSAALVGAVHAVMLMHNNTKGNLTPSHAEIQLSKAIQHAGELLHIQVVDHIVVAEFKYISLRQLGHI